MVAKCYGESGGPGRKLPDGLVWVSVSLLPARARPQRERNGMGCDVRPSWARARLSVCLDDGPSWLSALRKSSSFAFLVGP